ncbi:hypothetical protein Anapl_08260 [Anas platyrhynchos]|uniref:Uncharacterized protein n=1 Tax=Anas platyrhynchos TaxID=8839 RepID=R0KYX2_ANAPL|nr:hypothetical protein Anapl_08260 [Anas platyrhynchos]
MRRKETGPGLLWALAVAGTSCAQSQGRSRPHASDGDSILVAGGRSRGDSSLRREGLGTKLSFSKGWEASAAQLATLTGQPAARPVWLCSGKLHSAEPLGPMHRGSVLPAPQGQVMPTQVQLLRQEQESIPLLRCHSAVGRNRLVPQVHRENRAGSSEGPNCSPQPPSDKASFVRIPHQVISSICGSKA